MVPRYEQPDMSSIWTEEAKHAFFLEVELALLETLEAHGRVPNKGTANRIRHAVKLDSDRIREIEQTTQHDVIAFCTGVTEQVPPELGKWFHFGCTSSDVIDTALALQLKKSLELLLPEFRGLLKLMLEKAEKYKRLLTIGRSHGMYAEPMSFGQKFLYAYAELHRRYDELANFALNDVTGKMSGAVGNYTVLTPAIEADVMQRLNLAVEPVSTQVVPRDRLAKLASLVGLFASALERFEVEIRHLHRSDVAEVTEGFMPGQKGSSTMPHKKNPIAAENLTGVARLLRSYVSVALENVVLWHERDISHSSAERLYLPDMFGLMLYALRRAQKQLTRLEVDEAKVSTKAQVAWQSLSSYYMHVLLPQWQGRREDLYAHIQKAAFEAKDAADFGLRLQSTTGLALPANVSLESVYLAAVDETYARVKATYPLPV